MFAQLAIFDGPRSTELVAAADRASRDRIAPLMLSHPRLQADLVAGYRLRRADGGEIAVTLVRTMEAIALSQELIGTSQLLPGEDAALLPGPDRVEIYEVVDQFTSANQ